LDFAAKGQYIEWDEEEQKFYLCHKDTEEYLPEEKLKMIFRECLTGIHYRSKKSFKNNLKHILFLVHVNHIIHRDVKPQNILFDENDHVKIADFGQSILFEETDTTNSAEGTYWFMAPELLDPNTNKGGVSGKPCDIWSLGVTFFVFAYLEVPFYADNYTELLEKIKEGELVFPEKREISDDLKNILRKMLNRNAGERLTIE